MTYLQGATGLNLANNIATVTVPTGVTFDQTAIFLCSGDSKNTISGSAVATSSRGTATITPLFGGVAIDINNTYLYAYKVTGIQAGDTFTHTQTGGAHIRTTHFYFDTDIDVGTIGTRGGVTRNFETAPAFTVAAGSECYACSTSRITTTDAFSSVSNANGRTVTQRYSLFSITNPGVNVWLGQFTEPTTSTGTTTVTESASSGNGAAFHIVELPSVPVGDTGRFFAFI